MHGRRAAPGGALLAAAGVRVRTEPIARLAGSDGRLTQIEFSHGRPSAVKRVAGVYAAGDAATAHSRSVSNAIRTGSRVAYAVALERLEQVVAAAA